MMLDKKFNSLEKLIGKTPLIVFTYRYNGEVKTCCCKAEWYNLSGSIKDRVAYYIIKKAYEDGSLNKDKTIVEVTSGNMGIAFAAISRYLGNKMIAIMPKFMSAERFKLLEMYGAKLDLVDDFDDAFAKAKTYETKDYFLPHQFENKYNALAHYETTAPEIELQVNKYPCIIAGVGTAGTLNGVGSYFKEKYGSKVFALEPIQSSLLTLGRSLGSHQIQGLSDKIIPGLYPEDMVDGIIQVDDNDAICMAQKIAKTFGIGVGISSGANFLGCVISGMDGAITVFADDNKKYLSTGLANNNLHSDFVDKIELIDFEVIIYKK